MADERKERVCIHCMRSQSRCVVDELALRLKIEKADISCWSHDPASGPQFVSAALRGVKDFLS